MKFENSVILLVAAVVLVSGCGGGSSPGGGGAFEPVVLNYQDVVINPESEVVLMTEADPSAPPPEGLAEPAPVVDLEAQRVAQMSPRERDAYEEMIKPIKDSAAGEAQSNAVLLGDLNNAVYNYHFDFGKLPPDLGSLIKNGYLSYMPRFPKGKQMKINGKTLEVTLE